MYVILPKLLKDINQQSRSSVKPKQYKSKEIHTKKHHSQISKSNEKLQLICEEKTS